MAKTLHEIKPPPTTLQTTLRLTPEMDKELEIIAKYEQMKGKAEMCKNWVVERVSTYKDNVRYLAFKREFLKKEMEEETRKRQRSLDSQ